MYLVVQPKGGRSWRFDYRFQGTRKGISLGTYPEVSLALAGDRRAEARRLVAEGLDPSQVRQAAKRRISGIINGTRAITADTALRLGKYFGVSPELWLDLQSDFESRVARQNSWPTIAPSGKTREA